MRETLVKAEEFKDSPLGRIPKDWDVVPLSSVFQIQTGATPLRTKHQSYFVGGTIPWVKTMDLKEGWIVDTDERITEIALKECSVQLLPPKTVLIAMYGGWEQIGRTGILKDSATTNQAISSLIKISPLVEPEFVLRALQYGRFRWKGIAASTRKDPNITRNDVVNFLIPLPPLDEQSHIAEILDTVDETIAHTSSLIAKLKQMKAGLLRDLLTRGLDENGELRDAIGHPEQFKDSPLGQIPKDWDVKDLNSITSKIIDGTHFTPTYLEEGIPFLRVTDIQSSQINFNSVKRISLQEHRTLNIRCNPEFGDILYSKNGSVGITKVIDWRQEFSIFVSLCLIKPITALVDPWYLAEILQSPVVIEQIRVRSKQMTVVNLHLEEIREFLIPLANINEQKRIVEAVRIYNNRIRSEEAYRDKLKLQKQGLMHDLLTGKVRVKDADKFTPASDTV